MVMAPLIKIAMFLLPLSVLVSQRSFLTPILSGLMMNPTSADVALWNVGASSPGPSIIHRN